MHAPTIEHYRALKRILQHAKGTFHFAIQLPSSNSTQIHAFLDTYSASCPKSRQSTTSYCIFLGDHLVS